MNPAERTARAKRLQADDAFRELIKEFREDAITAFANSGAADTAAREEAHAMLRAVTKLEGMLDAAAAAQSFAERKDRSHDHRKQRPAH